MIAPYQADAQVAYLVKTNVVDFAITEDSDLIAYGCERIIFKLNLNGFADFLDLQKLCKTP